MPKTKQQKEEIVKKLNEYLERQKVAVFVDFKDVDTKNIEQLKKELKDADGKYFVAKKTLIELALKKLGINFNRKEYQGQMAIVFGFKDEIEPVKKVYDFFKKNKKFKILGGIFENSIRPDKEIESLALLPSKQELTGKLVWLISYPISGFENVLQGNLRNLVYALNQIKDKKGQ